MITISSFERQVHLQGQRQTICTRSCQLNRKTSIQMHAILLHDCTISYKHYMYQISKCFETKWITYFMFMPVWLNRNNEPFAKSCKKNGNWVGANSFKYLPQCLEQLTNDFRDLLWEFTCGDKRFWGVLHQTPLPLINILVSFHRHQPNGKAPSHSYKLHKLN